MRACGLVLIRSTHMKAGHSMSRHTRGIHSLARRRDSFPVIRADCVLADLVTCTVTCFEVHLNRV